MGILEAECQEGSKEYEGSYVNHYYLHWVNFLDIPSLAQQDMSNVIQLTCFVPLASEYGIHKPVFFNKLLKCPDGRAKSKWLSEYHRAERRHFNSERLEPSVQPRIEPPVRTTHIWESITRSHSADT